MAEEVSTTTYDNYKFLTLPEVQALSMDHLIGKTNLLRPYMHGYFVASKLYDQARLVANPYVYEEARERRIKEKIEEERASRIRLTKKVKVNQKIADTLLKKQEKRKKVDMEAGALGDPRLGKLFEDADFTVDETSAVFRALNPSTKVDVPAEKPAKAPKRSSGDGNGGSDSEMDDDDDSDEDEAPIRSGTTKPANSDVVMRMSSSAVQWGSHGTIGTRVQKMAASGGKNNGRSSHLGAVRSGMAVGERQVTFVPESNGKKKKVAEDEAARPAPQGRDNRVRRSASGNTFRKLRE